MTGEFDLIWRYFARQQKLRKDVVLGIGDDCALVKSPEFSQIAISTDTLVEGTHFVKGANPAWIAHKALASNLSDLAAMGAAPAWVSLALTLPKVDHSWLQAFSDAFYQLADYYNVQLIGGDTTHGPLSITLTVQGLLSENKALQRSGAKVGDWIYVTGNLGDAKAGLDYILGQREKEATPVANQLEQRHYMSQPRVYAGQLLIDRASATIDISDGLLADLQHILNRSQVGASIDVDSLPLSEELIEHCGDLTLAQQYALTSGEEYELCFTLPEIHRGSIDIELANIGTHLTCIGQIRAGKQLHLHASGQTVDWKLSGFEHFIS